MSRGGGGGYKSCPGGEVGVNGINHALGGVIIHVAIKYVRGGGGGGHKSCLGGSFNPCIGYWGWGWGMI